MAIDSSILRVMADAGCTVEQILKVAERGEFDERERSAARREAERVRKRRQRDREREAKTTVVSRGGGVTPVTAADSPSPPPAPSPKEIPPTPLEITLFPEPSPQPRVSSAREFDAFWSRYPNKVGKTDAFKAFEKSMQKVDIETLMAGLARYVAKTDDRQWCNPATWLNQGRWTDEPAQVARGSPRQREPTAGDIFGEMSRRIEDGIANSRTEIGGVASDEHHLRLVSSGPKY